MSSRTRRTARGREVARKGAAASRWGGASCCDRLCNTLHLSLIPQVPKMSSFFDLYFSKKDCLHVKCLPRHFFSFLAQDPKKKCKSGPRARRTPRSSRKRYPDPRAGLAGTLARPPTRRERPHRRRGKDEHVAWMEPQDLYPFPPEPGGRGEHGRGSGRGCHGLRYAAYGNRRLRRDGPRPRSGAHLKEVSGCCHHRTTGQSTPRAGE